MGQRAPRKYGKKLDLTSGGDKMQVATIEIVAPRPKRSPAVHKVQLFGTALLSINLASTAKVLIRKGSSSTIGAPLGVW